MSGVPPSQQEILESAGQTSIPTFLSALTFNSLVALGFYGAFWVLRTRVPLVYSPRTYLLPERQRTSSLKGLELLKSCIWASEETLIEKCGHDAYATVFYMRAMFKFFGSLAGLAIITLFPLHATGGQSLFGLNCLTLANIAPWETVRLWAHLVVSWIYSLACMFTIQQLLAKATKLRHSFLLSNDQRLSVSGYSLLIRDIPKRLRDPTKLHRLFDRVQPGCVHAVVALKRSKTLERYAERRRTARDTVEKEITKYLQNIMRKQGGNRRKGSITPDLEQGAHEEEIGTEMQEIHHRDNEEGPVERPHASDSNRLTEMEISPDEYDVKGSSDEQTDNPCPDKKVDNSIAIQIASDTSLEERREMFVGSIDSSFVWDECIDSPIPNNETEAAGRSSKTLPPSPSPLSVRRPTRRKMYVLGHKADAISTSLQTLQAVCRKHTTRRLRLYSSEKSYQGAAFVLFTDIFSPHVAALAHIHDRPGVMADRYACVNPDDVIWENLDVPYLQRRGRMLLATAVTLTVTVFWATITTFLSSLASLDKLIYYAPFLGFFNNFSPAVRGVIQGVVPTVAVSVVFQLIPIIMRRLSHFAGQPTYTQIERRLLVFYYIFLVFNILLVITISGSLFTAVVNMIEYPSRILSILATSIPTVSNFFVNYIMLLALGGPSGELLQLATLILKPTMLRLFGVTPRGIKEWSKTNVFMPGPIMAQHSFVATVGLTYCTVAPLVLVFVVLYFGSYAVAYGYQMQYVYSHLAQTGGLYLHTAARQLFVGVYLHQLVLLGLFLLKRAFAQSAIMAIALAITVLCHRHADLYKPLMAAAPAKAVLKMEERMIGTDAVEDAEQGMYVRDRVRRNENKIAKGSAEILKWNQRITRQTAERIHKVLAKVKKRYKSRKAGTSAETISESKQQQEHSNEHPAPQTDQLYLENPIILRSESIAASDDSESNASNDDSDMDPESVPSTSPRVNASAMANPQRHYLGPSDFTEQLAPPSARSAPLTLWIPKDMYGMAEAGIRREVEDAVGDAVKLTTEWARLDSDGRVRIDVEGIAEFAI
ncbi:uncharacterized protein SPPG_03389 [Spizellomyces punctatus DAOM BR117]|uniref:CSC1/OSCA1-like 7TM region domain-containing protein n=1 Tax=Spizellomyces punctatus (strain DAOM BR117) TaxID=645134 RepID=A0A0L0HJG6_SPIPD|nr:uncharacterized protein SPPG_03389 [Spizellomyces punctatus DAOM BR117]KND01591.1 hypothetical protein SPPG_03389 [Spizellomyces punctatus DAOM BR117]|eukprot:XP_016609630.1 hypothetical protein SPPG_03389 [Spizellomyces punctatus DAOM BR117]